MRIRWPVRNDPLRGQALALAIPTLFLLLTGVFVLVRLVPGDPAAVILGDQASQAALAALRAKSA